MDPNGGRLLGFLHQLHFTRIPVDEEQGIFRFEVSGPAYVIHYRAISAAGECYDGPGSHLIPMERQVNVSWSVQGPGSGPSSQSGSEIVLDMSAPGHYRVSADFHIPGSDLCSDYNYSQEECYNVVRSNVTSSEATLIVPANTGDLDSDGVVDFADLDSGEFVPFDVSWEGFPSCLDVRISFYINAPPSVFSDEESLDCGPTFYSGSGFRIWTKPASTLRNPERVIEGGHYVKYGALVSELVAGGAAQSGNSVRLYLEYLGVRPSHVLTTSLRTTVSGGTDHCNTDPYCPTGSHTSEIPVVPYDFDLSWSDGHSGLTRHHIRVDQLQDSCHKQELGRTSQVHDGVGDENGELIHEHAQLVIDQQDLIGLSARFSKLGATPSRIRVSYSEVSDPVNDVSVSIAGVPSVTDGNARLWGARYPMGQGVPTWRANKINAATRGDFIPHNEWISWDQLTSYSDEIQPFHFWNSGLSTPSENHEWGSYVFYFTMQAVGQGDGSITIDVEQLFGTDVRTFSDTIHYTISDDYALETPEPPLGGGGDGSGDGSDSGDSPTPDQSHARLNLSALHFCPGETIGGTVEFTSNYNVGSGQSCTARLMDGDTELESKQGVLVGGELEFSFTAPDIKGTYIITVETPGTEVLSSSIEVVGGGTFPPQTLNFQDEKLVVTIHDSITADEPSDGEGYFHYKGRATIQLSFGTTTLGIKDVVLAAVGENGPIVEFDYNHCSKTFKAFTIRWEALNIDEESEFYTPPGVDSTTVEIWDFLDGPQELFGFSRHLEGNPLVDFNISEVDLRLEFAEETGGASEFVEGVPQPVKVTGFNLLTMQLLTHIKLLPETETSKIQAWLLDSMHGGIRWKYPELDSEVPKWDFAGISDIAVEVTKDGQLIGTMTASLSDVGILTADLDQKSSLPIQTEHFTLTFKNFKFGFEVDIFSSAAWQESFEITGAEMTVGISNIEGVEGSFWGTAEFGNNLSLTEVEIRAQGLKASVCGGRIESVDEAGGAFLTASFDPGLELRSISGGGVRYVHGSLEPMDGAAPDVGDLPVEVQAAASAAGGDLKNYLELREFQIQDGSLISLKGKGAAHFKNFNVVLADFRYEQGATPGSYKISLEEGSMGMSVNEDVEVQIRIHGLDIDHTGRVKLHGLSGELHAHPLYIDVQATFYDTLDGAPFDGLDAMLSAEIGKASIDLDVEYGSHNDSEGRWRHFYGAISLEGGNVGLTIPYTGLKLNGASGGIAYNYNMAATDPGDVVASQSPCELSAFDALTAGGAFEKGTHGFLMGVSISDQASRFLQLNSAVRATWGNQASIALAVQIQSPPVSAGESPIVCAAGLFNYQFQNRTSGEQTPGLITFNGAAEVNFPAETGSLFSVPRADLNLVAKPALGFFKVNANSEFNVLKLGPDQPQSHLLKGTSDFMFSRTEIIGEMFTQFEFDGDLTLRYNKMWRFPDGFNEDGACNNNLNGFGFETGVDLNATAAADVRYVEASGIFEFDVTAKLDTTIFANYMKDGVCKVNQLIFRGDLSVTRNPENGKFTIKVPQLKIYKLGFQQEEILLRQVNFQTQVSSL